MPAFSYKRPKPPRAAPLSGAEIYVRFASDDCDALADDLRKSIDADIVAAIIANAGGGAGRQGPDLTATDVMARIKQIGARRGDGYQGTSHDPVGAQADAGPV